LHSHYCHFHAKHQLDASKNNDFSRWWPDWYRYFRDSVSNDMVVGDRILFHPNIFLEHSKYIQWGDIVVLISKACLLLGPFDFDPLSPSNHTRRKVTLDVWLQLPKICTQRDILPPTVGTYLKFNPDPPTDNRSIRARKHKHA